MEITDEHKNMRGGVYWNYVGAPGWKLCMVTGRDKRHGAERPGVQFLPSSACPHTPPCTAP
jgi:hypothetical protein